MEGRTKEIRHSVHSFCEVFDEKFIPWIHGIQNCFGFLEKEVAELACLFRSVYMRAR